VLPKGLEPSILAALASHASVYTISTTGTMLRTIKQR
jgi:hypothetical protein